MTATFEVHCSPVSSAIANYSSFTSTGTLYAPGATPSASPIRRSARLARVQGLLPLSTDQQAENSSANSDAPVTDSLAVSGDVEGLPATPKRGRSDQENFVPSDEGDDSVEERAPVKRLRLTLKTPKSPETSSNVATKKP
jgi:hypothetical protein